jgi:hypothetical protein
VTIPRAATQCRSERDQRDAIVRGQGSDRQTARKQCRQARVSRLIFDTLHRQTFENAERQRQNPKASRLSTNPPMTPAVTVLINAVRSASTVKRLDSAFGWAVSARVVQERLATAILDGASLHDGDLRSWPRRPGMCLGCSGPLSVRGRGDIRDAPVEKAGLGSGDRPVYRQRQR